MSRSKRPAPVVLRANKQYMGGCEWSRLHYKN